MEIYRFVNTINNNIYKSLGVIRLADIRGGDRDSEIVISEGMCMSTPEGRTLVRAMDEGHRVRSLNYCCMKIIIFVCDLYKQKYKIN
jgi:hypothetical protein